MKVAGYACLWVAGLLVSGYITAFGFRFTAPIIAAVLLALVGPILVDHGER